MTFISGTGTTIEQSGSGKITNADVYDTEVHGALAAIEAITASNRDRGRSAIYILLDNSAAVKALLTGTTDSSFWRIQKFVKMAARSAAPVEMGWIPGHEEWQEMKSPMNSLEESLTRRTTLGRHMM